MYYAYKYRLTPSDAHREELDRHRDICRQLYNHALYGFDQITEDAGTLNQRVRSIRDGIPSLKDWCITLSALTIFLVLLVLSGPLVPAINLTSVEDAGDPEPSSINATLTQPPDGEFTFRQGRFGSGDYYLEAPSAVINVTSLTGSPLVIYRVTLPTMDRSFSTVTFLDTATNGERVRLEFNAPSIAEAEITADYNPAVVKIFSRGGGEDTLLYNASATVTVEGR